MISKVISVAGFKIRLQSHNSNDIALEPGFIPFIEQEEVSKTDVLITSCYGIPDELTDENNPVFTACDQQQKFFSIFTNQDGFRIIVYDQQNINQIQQVAILDNDFEKWTVYSRYRNTDGNVFPLLYPLGPLVFYYLTVKYNAVMIHASGVFDGQTGRIFTGFSGAGKSTMAFLWQKADNGILNDDRLIIRKENGVYFMYNTPMIYSDIPKKAPLNAIYVIRHAPENSVKKLTGAVAASSVMSFCIQHNYCPSFIEHHLDFLANLTKITPVYQTGFVPDESIIHHIKSHAV